MSEIKTIRELRREKRRKEIEASKKKTEGKILKLRRKICGPGYDNVVNNMKNPNGTVDLYLDKDKKVAFTSDVACVYIKFKGADLMKKQITVEKANEILAEWLESGKAVTSYALKNNFYI